VGLVNLLRKVRIFSSQKKKKKKIKEQ